MTEPTRRRAGTIRRSRGELADSAGRARRRHACRRRSPSAAAASSPSPAARRRRLLARAVGKADRLGQGDRDAGRRALRAGDLAALQRRAGARRPAAGQGSSGAFRRRSIMRPATAEAAAVEASSELTQPAMAARRRRCSAWAPTATPPRSFPMRHDLAKLLDRRSTDAYRAAGAGRERRRAAADAAAVAHRRSRR